MTSPYYLDYHPPAEPPPQASEWSESVNIFEGERRVAGQGAVQRRIAEKAREEEEETA